MSNRLKSIIAALMITITSVFGVLLSSTDIHATTTSDLLDKFYARGLTKCYESGAMVKSIIPTMATSTSAVILNNDALIGVPPEGDNSSPISCEELLKRLGFNGSINSSNAAESLAILGYKVGGTDGSKCMKFNFETDTENGKTAIVSPVLCASGVGSDGIIKGDILGLNETPPPTESGQPDGSEVYFEEDPYANTVYFHIGTDDAISQSTNCSVDASTTWTALTNCFEELFNDKGTFYPASMRQYRYKAPPENAALPDSLRSYNLVPYSSENKAETSYIKAFEGLTKRSFPSLSFTPEEKAVLYQNYLASFYNIEKENCVSKKADLKSTNLQDNLVDKGLTDGWNKAKLFTSDGTPEYCYVKGDDQRVNLGVFGVQAHGGTEASMVNDPGSMNILAIIDWLNSSSPDKITDAGLLGGLNQAITGNNTSDSSTDESGSDEGSESCFDGAGALGWVLCPILEGTSWAINQLYSGFIEPALTINADLLTFDGNGDKGAYATWQTFQTFANIAFVIMILVVIFSQLTGVGIDNYGIKRILPRLIIAAILINLSFIICQLLVDLSNILGVSLKNLFNNLGPDYKAVGGSTGGAIFVDILIGVVAVGGAFLALGLGVLIPILVAAISALIAIFFLFLVLAGRQAAVVILVVISPIALVMYMLPNTKKYFDKFVKIFVTLLVVFPVCGLLMGGGDFASRVLLQAGQASANSFSSTGEGFFYQISAVLVSIVPFFFIPSLVKGSLAGLGNIGAKISSIGSKVGGRASGTARNTLGNTRLGDPSRFKRWSNVRRAERRDSAEREANLRRAQSRVKRLNARRENGKVLDEADVRRLAVAQATVDKYGGEDLAARTSLAMLDYGNSSEKDIREAWRKAFKAGDGNQLRAVTNVMQSRFGSNAAKFIGDDLEGLESEGIDIANNANAQASMKALQDHANNDGKFAGDLKSKAYDAQAMIASGGVVREWKDPDGTVHKEYGNLSHFTAGGGGAKLDTIEDISTQGTGAIRRAVAAGAITAEQAASVLSSSDQRIQSGIASDAGKREELMKASFTDGSTVADHVKKAQADQAREAKNEKLEQEEKELQVQHHEDAMAIGQRPITVGSISFRGYETPAGFTPAGDPVQDADGHWIYTDKTNGRTWDATTGRYGKPIQGPFPKP